jgi:hypothetical protein
MSRFPESVSPDALRQSLNSLRSNHAAAVARIAALEAEAPATTTVTGWTDALPRAVKYPIDYTQFKATAATIVNVTLDSLPAGLRWTHVWIEPVRSFVSAGLFVWRGSVVIPATGATAGGSPKSVDITTPDALSQQAASWFVQCDNSAPVTLEAQIDSGGTDTADLLADGSANIYITLSVPGSTADDLPHQ